METTRNMAYWTLRSSKLMYIQTKINPKTVLNCVSWPVVNHYSHIQVSTRRLGSNGVVSTCFHHTLMPLAWHLK
jgi:hypothetical protein